MIVAAVTVGSLGVLAAVALGVAARVFYVEVDPLAAAIEEELPGANCGGCGQAGCAAAAVAIAGGDMPANACVAGGQDVGRAIAALMGVEIKDVEPQVAQVGCRYPVQRSDLRYRYDGVADCRAAVLLAGGPKECPVGCVGLGACAKACPFDALEIGPDGLPVVNPNKCTGCGTCVRTCPMGIMDLTSVTDRIVDEYELTDCTAPCQRRCPAGIDVPLQVFYTAQGRYDEALLAVKDRNPLPLICGRICPSLCETECRRNLADDPVAINHLKRFVADRERESGRRQQLYKAPATGVRAAVIGGGAEGLSAAFFLARLGHSPTIYEAEEELGGLLRTVIPEDRLPRDVLDWEIEGILEMGVEARTGSAFGRDFGLAGLFEQEFGYILVSTGGWDAMLTGQSVPSAAPSAPWIYLLISLHLAWMRGESPELGGRVVLVGRLRELLGAARKVIEKGADKVTILDRWNDSKSGLDPEETDKLRNEGIQVVYGASVVRLAGIGDRLTHVFYEYGGKTGSVEADSVVVAAGRIPDMIIRRDLSEPPDDEEEPAPHTPPGEETPWTTVMPYDVQGRRPRDLFHDRGPVSDYRAAVEAIGAGRRAAASIHKMINGEEPVGPPLTLGLAQPLAGVNSLENLVSVGPRATMPQIPPEERLDDQRETALGLEEDQARAEASRCLNCGLICYYRTKYE